MGDVLLTVTSTADQASDLGYLLHKHPDRLQSFELSVGTAHVFYPEATSQRCTVALLLEVDPVGLVRSKRFHGDTFALSQYVNDRPYAASSLLAVALGRVFRTALQGRCPARPDLEGSVLPLTVRVPTLPAESPDLVDRLFAPLGWQVEAVTALLDPAVPRWGDAPYVDLTLAGAMTLREALSHLYVLLPVIDGAKHYWVSSDEVDKLVRNAGGWLGNHPERELITRRYLAHQRSFVTDATDRLAALDDSVPVSSVVSEGDSASIDSSPQTSHAGPPPLVHRRREAVLAALRDVGAHRVVDLGCGEGALLRELLADPGFTEVVGVDVSAGELDRAAKRLGIDRMPDSQRSRLTLRQSSATYRDSAIAGFDAVVLMEVVEHVDPDRLPALESSVFGHAAPGAVVVTTPNADYNPLFETLAAGTMRHPDHRFEWSRAQFRTWAERVCHQFGYAVELRPVGEVHPELGPPTSLALFTRQAAA